MELIIVTIGIGLSLVLNVIALTIFHRFVESVKRSVAGSFIILEEGLMKEHNKTRKDIQEVKTRLTQVRKDLNKLEKREKTDITHGQIGFTIKSDGSNVFPISRLKKRIKGI